MDASETDESKQTLLKQYVGDGSISLSGKPVERGRTGVWRAAPFIYVLIFADTVSVLGIAGNLVPYAFGTLHLSVAESANTVTNFMGLTYLLPLVWGFLADAYIGRFWIISFTSISSLSGLVVLTLSTSLPSLQPPSCTSTEENLCPTASPYVLSWFYAALLLVSLGSSGLKPCMLSLGKDQFDDTHPEEKKQGAKFFTGYYIALNIYSIFCVTVLFYIQSSVSLLWGYGTIAAIYFCGLSIFFLGTRFFRHRKPAGSTLTRAAQVFVAAFTNRNKKVPANPDGLYELDNKRADVEGIRKIVYTPKLRCLDKAAIVSVEGPHHPSKWQLCTVTQVEELKCVLQIIPIWLCMFPVFTLYAQVMGIGVQQASTLDRKLGRFTLAPGNAAVALMLSGLAFIYIYRNFLVPPLRKITGHPDGLSPLRQMGVAVFLAIVAMVVGASVEARRIRIIEESGIPDLQEAEIEVPMSIFWLMPQLFGLFGFNRIAWRGGMSMRMVMRAEFKRGGWIVMVLQFALLGFVEVLLGIAQLHFLYEETPDNMRSLAVALTFTTISVGYFVSSALVNAVNSFSARSGGWLADDFNKGGLTKFYYLLAVFMSVDLLVFIAFAYSYTYKKVQPASPVDPVDVDPVIPI